MKDELIDTINAKISRKRHWMTASAFILTGLNVLVIFLITHYKHPELVNISDATLIKGFLRNFS